MKNLMLLQAQLLTSRKKGKKLLPEALRKKHPNLGWPPPSKRQKGGTLLGYI